MNHPPFPLPSSLHGSHGRWTLYPWSIPAPVSSICLFLFSMNQEYTSFCGSVLVGIQCTWSFKIILQCQDTMRRVLFLPIRMNMPRWSLMLQAIAFVYGLVCLSCRHKSHKREDILFMLVPCPPAQLDSCIQSVLKKGVKRM